MIFSMNQASILPVGTLSLFIAACLLTTALLLTVVAVKRRGKLKRVMGVWLLACLAITLILFGGGAFGKFVNTKTIASKPYTKSQLTSDMQQLEKLVMEENPLYFTDRGELERRFQAAYELIRDDMTELEFYRLINPLVVGVGCGHTNLSISDALHKSRAENGRFFPLKVTLIDNQLIFLEENPARGISAGDQIMAINGKTSPEIIEHLIANISGDSNYESKRRHILSRHFNNKFHDFVDNSSDFLVEFQSKAGELRTANLQAKFREEFNTTAWTLHFSEFGDGNYYESIIHDDYAVLRVHVFLQEEGNKFETYLDDFFAELKEENISKLVVDLRGNYGGDPFMAQALLSHLISERVVYFADEFPLVHRLAGFDRPVDPAEVPFEGELVVLIDGACFSTAAHLISFIKAYELGTLVGSETGGSYVCTDSSKDAVLRNTRINLHYSTRTYTTSVKGFAADRGIKPDLEVSPTIEDVLSGADVQMERALEVMGVEYLDEPRR